MGGNDVWIGYSTTIMAEGVTIGDSAIWLQIPQ
jgi:acetyltransferase-like isoleucine patch superfamily enzyme